MRESLPEDLEVREYKGKSCANKRFTDGLCMNRVFTQPTQFVKGISHQDLDVATDCSDGGNSNRSAAQTQQSGSEMLLFRMPRPPNGGVSVATISSKGTQHRIIDKCTHQSTGMAVSGLALTIVSRGSMDAYLVVLIRNRRQAHRQYQTSTKNRKLRNGA